MSLREKLRALMSTNEGMDGKPTASATARAVTAAGIPMSRSSLSLKLSGSQGRSLSLKEAALVGAHLGLSLRDVTLLWTADALGVEPGSPSAMEKAFGELYSIAPHVEPAATPAAAFELYAEGGCVDEIAEHLGKTPRVIAEWLKKG